ncbi:hypothetical protein OIU34_21675 [Pararhizobium sp. BT-229]|uniref:hypothetical protein n=1 Tax=Pararhizobium sp. BT-229 TaxID=2986923 RepID=UPI0021F7D485|nr:hypothetical protein [Pararhizobium sp. BT-229]MCV9964503.1 hypothetical protein [Pararhizobium sp. BT-229]
MRTTSGETKTRAFLDFSAEAAARLQAMDPAMSLSDIVKSSLELLGKAAEALAAGLEFGSCAEDGTMRRVSAMAPLEAARKHDTKYAPAKA